MSTLLTLLDLFWTYVKISCVCFGGMSMVPLLNAEMISHGWMNAHEVSDIVAIAEMTPGPLGLNCATFAGMKAAGVLTDDFLKSFHLLFTEGFIPVGKDHAHAVLTRRGQRKAQYFAFPDKEVMGNLH